MINFFVKDLKDIHREFSVSFGKGKNVSWKFTSPVGPNGITEKEADLLDFAFGIYIGERMLSGYRTTNPPSEITVEFESRNSTFWNKGAIAALEGVLQIFGNCRWKIKIVQGKAFRFIKPEVISIDKEIDQVIMFSGGMDSTCGLAHMHPQKEKSVLASFYTKQKTLQRKINREFKYPYHIQCGVEFRDIKGNNKSFLYRSFLFLSLAGVVANTFALKKKRRKIFQFENGILALSIPPSPAYMMTKHAHPEVHKGYSSFLDHYFGGTWAIENPFMLKTKKQAVDIGYSVFPKATWDEILKKTETCWYFFSNQLGNDDTDKPQEKNNNQHCGCCIPCIIRQTAFEQGGYSYNIRRVSINSAERIINNSVTGVHYRAYLDFTKQVLDTITVKNRTITAYHHGEFLKILPPAGRELLLAGIRLEDIHELWANFAVEFKEANKVLF